MTKPEEPLKKTPTLEEVWDTIFSCSHSIWNDHITLRYDGKGKNAANELHNRLKKLFES